MLSQLEGLASAVGFPVACYSTPLALPWRYMPLALIPRHPISITTPELLQVKSPPRLVLSCGRHGVIPALTLKKQFGNRVLAVHIQDPTGCGDQFDLVVSPKHDYARGPNVYLTTGAVHYVTPERLAEAANHPLAHAIASDERPLVTVLIGGPNSYYDFAIHDLEQLIGKLRTLCHRRGVRLAILPSNRTTQEISDRLTHEFAAEHYVWDRASENPYFTALALARYLVVTSDSVSMTTEAAATGRPVFVEYLREKRRATRFRRFHLMFEEDGITRPFAGELAEWEYKPPNDTPQVAQIIKERIANNEHSAQRAAAHDRAA